MTTICVGQASARDWEPSPISHLGGRKSSLWAITCCLARFALAASWNQILKWESNPVLHLQDAGVTSGVLRTLQVSACILVFKELWCSTLLCFMVCKFLFCYKDINYSLILFSTHWITFFFFSRSFVIPIWFYKLSLCSRDAFSVAVFVACLRTTQVLCVWRFFLCCLLYCLLIENLHYSSI